MGMQFPKISLTDGILAALRGGGRHAAVAGAWGSAKSLLAVETARGLKAPLLIVAPGRVEAEAVHDDLVTFSGEERCALFPAWEVLPTDSMNPADDIVAERMNTLKRILAAFDAGDPLQVVCPVRSILQYVVEPRRLREDTVTLRVRTECDLDALLEKLVKMGYTREVMVEQRGEISLRGGILDVFPISSELPFRVEFFGDEIDSIRRFEPETQRSIGQEDEVQILPRSEKAMLAASARANSKLTPLTDYFPKNTVVFVDEPPAVEETARTVCEQAGSSPYYMDWPQARHRLEAFALVDAAQSAFDPVTGEKPLRMTTLAVANFGGRNDEFWAQLRQWEAEQYTVQLLCVNTGERRRLLELLEEQGYLPGRDAFDLRVGIGRLRAGFVSPADKLVVLSEGEIFGRHYVRRKRRRFEAGTGITQFGDLKSGDYVVHEIHGIGRYLGLRRFEGKAGDFMALQYAGGDTIYVPVTHIDQLQKYLGGDGAVPKMDKIGGASWARTRAKVKKAVRDLTADLVKLYAARETARGHAFSPDTPWQREFEDAFEYEETPDQARAIAEVKRDMESPRPMDRLLCGDVGYGKTEVALRAAFKSVMDGKQVVLLAPTTVLAQQHFNTFRERLADYPVRLDLLNRFRTPRQQKETISRLKAGEVDIVIGTHRLLSKDVGFKDLGLVVIDEEQRFGVAHKERLKQMRNHVDVLTMSATPIPRTLHMSLIGVRDMSVINTAPNDRLPIHTCIEAWDQNLLREAVERELGRQGQVFFLHNRVQTIEKVATFLQKMVPRARIGIGHGQMEKHELEDVMAAFINRALDILVCTTIIGSGIDIPNANTIIVDRADHFGLSQLYQIRGRVGRYKHRAFAYLLVPGDRALSEDAQQRLKALEDFSSLGAGFRIAMRDLEIRGAGDLLGAEQSGQIASVGYETYRELIAEAVAEAQGKPLRRRQLPPFDAPVDAFIPDEYIPTAQQKMTMYRRMAAVGSPEEVTELRAELKDRFGAPPRPVDRLLRVMEVRTLALEADARALAAGRGTFTVVYDRIGALSPALQTRLERLFGRDIRFDLQNQPAVVFSFPAGADLLEECLRAIKILAQERQRLDE
ncbi:MAG: transcription-repair coupling factor [Candidatus Hydrogenedentes bacterium]|nr:transcription-repair coupling factor [Candidatus Hydrogenedentota bacterium]